MAKIKTILYAEDDQVVLMAYRKYLQQAGFHVIPAHDGLEAMKNLSIFVPDLIVLDLMMPKFSGEEVLQFICGNNRLAKVPLIVLSSNSVGDVDHEQYLERADRRLLKYKCTPARLLEAAIELMAAIPAEEANLPDPVEVSFSGQLQLAKA
jgi:CheY-like chemotaxis protein